MLVAVRLSMLVLMVSGFVVRQVVPVHWAKERVYGSQAPVRKNPLPLTVKTVDQLRLAVWIYNDYDWHSSS